MSEQNENKKNTAVLNNLWSKASDFSKKVADGVQQGVQSVSDNVQQSVQTMSDKAKNDSYERRMKKYNPLFAKEFRSKQFHRSDIIMIGNDAERRDVDVCEGAIGWQEYAGDSVVLCLYRNWIEKCGLTFVPEATEGSIYCVDRFNPNRYIEVNSIFDRAHSEKLAELENIAYCLGAKSCEIEIVEIVSESEASHKNVSAKAKFLKMTGAQNENAKSVEQHSGKKVTTFEGNSTPRQPDLKWFADDVNIKGLIEMRCSNDNSIKTRTLTLEGSSLVTMSQKTAACLDIAIAKNKAGTGTSMERRMEKERSCRLIFNVVF